ncbi:MAG: GNAT family N-acetyltransferase [Alphaproteobacteria bacterium]|nr:MAG: GNAT family N-acetyltransferase [Alphaproteobacteria bacterium]
MSARPASASFARERADASPRAIGRAEWRTLAALAEIRGAWRDLSGRALEPNVFYDPAFALAAAPVFGADVGAVLVWSNIAPQRLIGLFPLRIERRYGLMTTLTGWTHPYAPLGVPLVDRDEADGAIGALLAHVEADARLPQLVVLPLIARDGAFAEAMARVLAQHGGAAAHFGEHARALLAPDERASYLDHVAHKKRKELRRQRRRLDEKGAVTFVSAHEPGAIAPALADYLMIEAAGWKGRAGTAARQNADVLHFVQSAIAALSADNRVRIDRLTRGEMPLAAAITLSAGDRAWFWKIAYDEAHASFSPGVQLTLALTQQLLADEAIAQTDSCATADHPMIDHLWCERLALTDLLIAPGRAALAQFHIARHFETLRRVAVTAAKTLRNRTR